MKRNFFNEQPITVSTAKAAISTDADGDPIATIAISVATAGAYTLTNPDGTTCVITLAAGTIHPISTKVALGTPAGTVTYWY